MYSRGTLAVMHPFLFKCNITCKKWLDMVCFSFCGPEIPNVFIQRYRPGAGWIVVYHSTDHIAATVPASGPFQQITYASLWAGEVAAFIY